MKDKQGWINFFLLIGIVITLFTCNQISRRQEIKQVETIDPYRFRTGDCFVRNFPEGRITIRIDFTTKLNVFFTVRLGDASANSTIRFKEFENMVKKFDLKFVPTE